MIRMETAISASPTCIEISSDEDCGNEDDTSVGLGSSGAETLFEEFLHKCSLFGITDENVRRMRATFQDTSANFLNGDEFAQFISGVLLRIKRDNAQMIVTEVYQCLRSEKINCTSPNLPITAVVTHTPSHSQTSSKQFCNDIEDAKQKLVEFFNRQANKKYEDQLSSSTLQKNSGPTALLSNGSDNTSGFTVPGGIDDGNTTKRRLQEPPVNNGEININAHGREQHMNNDGHSKKKRRTINWLDQHHSIPTLSKLDSSDSFTKEGKSKNDDCSDDVNDANLECGIDDCNDDIIILSVIPKSKSTEDPHSSSITTAASRQTYNKEEEKNDSSGLEEKKKRRQAQIKSIKEMLKFYDNEIRKLMTAELSLDEMNNEDSSYMKESKLKEKYCRLHARLCKLQKSKHTIDTNQYSRIKIEGCPYPEINREAERYIQSKKKFPDFFDIKSVVCGASRIYKLNLKPQEEVDIAREVFSEIGDKLQRKRKREFTKYSGSFLTDQAKDTADPALTDHNLRKKLKKNRKISKSNTEELFKHYSRLQYQGCENTCVSSDDEVIEKTILQAQRKLSPTKVEQVKTESISTVQKGSPGVISSNAANLAIPSTKAVKETSLSSQSIQGAISECKNEAQVCKVEKSEWDGNSCQPKYSQTPYNHLSKDSMLSQNSITDRNAEKTKHLNGHCVELDYKTGGLLKTNEELRVAKGDLGKLGKKSFTDVKYPEGKNIYTTPLSSGTISSTIIVIESDDD